ncbi:VRR-NUC domain-containing protein [Cellulosimicrobium sp. NPDC057862]|uniref:VRR-NUC domain-containing protein n=1 Tax=Actinomycetes TaxID=1760 RepID=UPI00366E0B69
MRTWTPAEYHADVAAGMKEDALQAQVIAVARDLGFLVYHTHDSRKSERGWPDLVLVHPTRGRLLYRELKQQKRYPTPEQRKWLAALAATGADVGVWRPLDILERRVHAELQAPQPTLTSKEPS